MAQLHRIFPKWAQSLGALAHSNALVRSQCECCGIQLRVDPRLLAMKYGAGETLVDRAEKCSVVACHGRVFFVAARSYGREWLTMISDAERREALADAAPAANAASLNLVKHPAYQ